ncbi:hypothetical protein ABTH88_19745, partial [Acinetobacter baumannii]
WVRPRSRRPGLSLTSPRAQSTVAGHSPAPRQLAQMRLQHPYDVRTREANAPASPSLFDRRDFVVTFVRATPPLPLHQHA